MVGAIQKANPNMTPEDVGKLVAQIFKKSDADKIETKIDKEAARLIPAPVLDEDADRIFLKKDTDKRFPLHKSALDHYIVHQTYKKKTEEDEEVVVPARNLNELGVYTKEEYDRLSTPGTGGFARQNVTAEVWHKPGQTGTVQE